MKTNNEDLHLSVSAKLILQLGQQLIENEFVALFELIKNTYDADATRTKISIDTKKETKYGKGQIVIEDNGNGMLPSIIKNAFLKISHSFKVKNNVSPRFNRLALGDKGIGRLSFNRLGHYIEVESIPDVDMIRSFYEKQLETIDNPFIEKTKNYINLSMDWSFLDYSAENNINLLLEESNDVLHELQEKLTKSNTIDLLHFENKILDINKKFDSIISKISEKDQFLKRTSDLQENIASVKYKFEKLNELLSDKSRIKIFTLLKKNKERVSKIDALLKDDISSLSLEDVPIGYFDEFRKDINKKHGTKIIISGLKNLDTWENKKSTEIIKKEIFGMVNPYSSSKFKISLNINDKFLDNDSIDESAIANTSFTEVNFTLDKSILSINIKRNTSYFHWLIKKRVRPLLKEDNNKLTIYDENLSELLTDHLLIDLNDLKDARSRYPKLSFDFKTIDSVFAYPGDFKGNFYATSLDQVKKFANESSIGLIDSEIKNLWNTFHGVFVFRKDFRILPYGEKDWLDFTKLSQRTKNNLFKEHTVSGHIDLDGRSSKNLKEQTNRQGFMIDEYGHNFETICKHIIARFSVLSDVRVREQINEFTKSKRYFKNNYSYWTVTRSEYNEKEKRRLEEVILKNLSTESNKNSLSRTTDLHASKNNQAPSKKAFKEIKDYIKISNSLINFKEEQKITLESEIDNLKDLVPSVGQALIIETMTHELARINENIRSYTNDSLKLLSKMNLDDKLESIESNLFNINHETVYIVKQLNHLSPTYKKNRFKYEDLDLKKYLLELYSSDTPLIRNLKDKSIELNISGDSFSSKINKGFLITIFDNLLLNSKYWLIQEMPEENRYINFKFSKDGTIIVYDSGIGIHPDIENTLFEPFKSMKKLEDSKGRGLGLYIASELLKKMNASISLLDELNDYKRKFKFKIEFHDIKEN